MVRARRGTGRVAALCVAAAILGACSAKDIKDTLYVGGKIAYDTFKNAHENDRPRY